MTTARPRLLPFALLTGVLLAVGAGCSRKADPDELVEVVVAGFDIPAGTTMEVDMLARRWVPQQFASDNVVRADRASEVVKQLTLIGFSAGDPILRSALGPKTGDAGFSAQVGDTWRGLWVEVSTPVALTETLRRGDRVDVLLELKDPETNGLVVTTPVQDVAVLDVRPRAAALLLTPADSARLALGLDLGTLRLSVRNPNDRQSFDGGSVGVDALLPRPPAGGK